jgi:putative tricarboxylic transport membrane protein
VGETFYAAAKLNKVEATLHKVKGAVMMTADDWKRSWKPWLRGTAIGFPFGAMPAGGAEIPTFLSYATEKKLAANPDEFGHGAIEGVAGPEAANNASSTGVMVPLLTLGLPTSATAAILLAAFQQYGLQPGPLLFETNAPLVWGLIASFYVGNLMLLVLNLPMIRIWIKLLEVPKPQLYAGIVVFASMGVYGMRQSAFDVFLLHGIGLMGFLMRRYGFPTAPVIVGMILGPLAEEQMRRSLAISQGDAWVFLQRPISGSILVLTMLLAIGPWLWRKVREPVATVV